jgi:hypothetical protein
MIEVSRARDAVILAKWEALAQTEARILCSLVTAGEVWAGARPAEFHKLTALFHELTCAPIDTKQVGRPALI